MMFPSNSCNGDDQAFFCRPFFTNNDINNIIPNSKQQLQQQQDPLLPLPSPTSLSSFFYFPSPFEEEQVVHDLDLLQNHPDDLVFQSHHHELQASSDKTTVTNKSPTTTTTTTMVDSLSAMMTMTTTTTTTMNIQNHMNNNVTELVLQQQIPRKRSSKRDRHSKINTARGPRDRRMRLSLEVARKFFGLQDMLGFDKASKTVEWLLIQAKSQIKNLARDLKQPSSCSAGTKSTTTCSTSECEVVSGLLIDGDDDDDDDGNDNDNRNHRRCGRKSSSSSSLSPKMMMMKKKKKGSRQLSRKNAFHPVARESRDKARARARERTRLEKLRRLVGGGGGGDHESKLYCDHDHEATNINQENPSRLGSSSWSPFEFETGEESGTQSQNINPTNSLADQDMVDDDSLVIMQAKWSPSSIFNSLQNSNGISQEHQFADFQFFGKPWDICNTHNLC